MKVRSGGQTIGQRLNYGIPTFVFALVLVAANAARSDERPDVLFFVVDDMNNWISVLDPKSPIKTPNIERLARRGTLFTRAYCASPACNPSRVAALTGQRPTTTGVYDNKSDWHRAVQGRPTIMQQFRTGGYTVKGAGKIFHHQLDGAFHDDASFDEFQQMRQQRYPPEKLNRAPEYGSRNTDWGAWPASDSDTIDVHTADYCIEALANPPQDKPLFLACGIYKPHSPFFAPARFHEPFATIPHPLRLETDWEDLPTGARDLMQSKKWFWSGMEKLEARLPGSYHAFVRAYAACCTFADTQIGRVLDALDADPRRRDNTIVVLWSDHGFHLGEKHHIEKFALWEKANHVPLIIVAPGVTEPGTRYDSPVDLMALYPTLLELAGLPPDAACDGLSIVPLLKDPHSEWPDPALTTYGQGNHSVRSKRWRFIRYRDGTEELYDHDSDPNEWENVAREPQHAAVIEEHRKWLPTREATRVEDLRNSRDTENTHKN